MNPNKKRVLVIGLGPCGAIFAGHLAKSGHQVLGVDTWAEHVEAIRSRGIAITRLVSLRSQLEVVSTNLETFYGQEFDYVGLAVKAPAMRRILPRLNDLSGNFKLLVMQNGLDNEEDVARFFPRDRILRLAVNYAGNVAGPGVIQMNFFQKPNRLGCICGLTGCTHARGLAEIMTASALDTQAVADIKYYTWKKTILNAILAPVCALLDATMAEALALDSSRRLVEALIRESIAVARAAGYDYGEHFFAECLDFLRRAGAHKPSMLIDLEKGRATEIDYINGKIAAYGERYGVPVPFNRTITDLVKAREYFKKKDQTRETRIITGLDVLKRPRLEPSRVYLPGLERNRVS